jgi:hypothetical protein
LLAAGQGGGSDGGRGTSEKLAAVHDRVIVGGALAILRKSSAEWKRQIADHADF